MLCLFASHKGGNRLRRQIKGMFDYHIAIVRNHAQPEEPFCRILCGSVAIGRVKKNDVEPQPLPAKTFYRHAVVRLHDARAVEKADRPRVLFDATNACRVMVIEDGEPCAPGQGLQAQISGAGKQIQNEASGQIELDAAEQRLFDAIQRRARTHPLRRFNSSSSCAACDNTHAFLRFLTQILYYSILWRTIQALKSEWVRPSVQASANKFAHNSSQNL